MNDIKSDIGRIMHDTIIKAMESQISKELDWGNRENWRLSRTIRNIIMDKNLYKGITYD